MVGCMETGALAFYGKEKGTVAKIFLKHTT